MADNPLISQITLPSGTTYDIKDAKARQDIATLQAYSDYLGVTTTTLADGDTTASITINGETVTPAKGNIVNFGSKEFIFNGSAWQEFGDLSALSNQLGELAYEDYADVTVSATGTAAAQTFTGETATYSITINQGTVSASGSYTPSGSVSVSESSTITFAGGVETSTASVKVLDSAGSVTAGSAASFTQGTDTFSATVSGEVLSLSFTQGTDTFTPNAPTQVSLDSFKDQTVVTSATSGTSTISVPSAFTFSGTAATISVTGDTSGVSADSIEVTPSGTNAASSVSVAGTITASA